MRQPRFTYRGAFHHCMNRGHGGEAILAGDERKRIFLDLLGEKAIKYHLRLFAYCLMDNHYHLVLQNASGRMSDFFRNLSTQYAFFSEKLREAGAMCSRTAFIPRSLLMTSI
jgi:putative transposase